MGGNNREHRNTNRMLDTEQSRVNQDYGQYTDRREQLAGDVRNRSNDAYNDIYRRATGLLDDPNSFGYDKYREFANGGSVTDENRSRIRGNGVFDEYAKTGGISEGQKQLIRAQAAAGGRGIYDSTQRQMDTGYSAQGGFNPGYNAQNAKLIRDSARAVNEANMGAELGIEDRVSEGRKWGAGSLSNAELGLVDAEQRGKMFGIEGMARDGTTRASLIDSLRGLRSDTPGELAMYEQLISGAMGNRAQANSGLLGTRSAANPQQPGWLDKLIGAAVPVGTSLLTGGASSGGRRSGNTGFTGGSYGYSLGA